uniref:Uncharacterized protein n=1 Tax=Amphimedon queenslandica TaxID=400682 RepID=A0A1X7SIJ6_AMPQE
MGGPVIWFESKPLPLPDTIRSSPEPVIFSPAPDPSRSNNGSCPRPLVNRVENMRLASNSRGKGSLRDRAHSNPSFFRQHFFITLTCHLHAQELEHGPVLIQA